MDNTTDASKPLSSATVTALTLKQNNIIPGAHIADAQANAATNAVTNYNALTSLLTLATGLNDTNTKQNDLATKYNDLATKYNSLLRRLEPTILSAT